MEEKKILVACNSLDFLLISKTLSQSFLLDWAQNCEEVLTYRKQTVYDLLLVDVALLRAGFEVLEGVVSEHLPVIAISSEPYDARNKKLMEAGCCACYIKPIRQDLFADFINYWIDQYSRN